jgi:protocatechuate 3,4-dioxygenase beta subunit
MSSEFTRRQALFTIMGTGIAAATAGCGASISTAPGPDGTGMCVLTGEEMEGPAYNDPKKNRQDIAEGKVGVPLTVQLRLLDAKTCEPIRDATISLWHCDAEGRYSGYPKIELDPNDPGAHLEPQNDEIWLRGTQVTDADGKVEFRTILPGWYGGRAPHGHFKVFLGSSTVLTSQFYFVEDLLHAIYAENEPYKARPIPDITNAADMVIQQSGAVTDAPILALQKQGARYLGQMTIGVLRK